MKKRLVTALACMMLAAALPMSVHAEEGKRIHGDSMQQNAAEMKYDIHYYEAAVDDKAAYYYKFRTDKTEGIYLISLASIVGSTSANGTVTVQVKDQYGTVVEQQTAGGAGAAYRNTLNGKAIDVVLPVSGLEKEKNYYICVVTNDGDNSKQLEVTNKLCVECVPFVPASNFTMKNNANGSMEFTWSNVQNANTYSPLSAYDGFQLELNANNVSKTKYIGNGGVTSYTLAGNDADLIALGYPATKVRIKLGSLQNYRSAFEDKVQVTKCVYSTQEFFTTVVTKKVEAKSNGFTYRITKVKGDGTGTVSILGLSDKNSAGKTMKIPDRVTINGISYMVTAIEKNAFKNNAKVTTLEIGENVEKIDKSAFFNCPKLKTIRFKSRVLNTIGKDAFNKIPKKTKVYCPDKTFKKKYKKLLKKKISAGTKYYTL
ncbi:leucine-rich repeat protein [Butyrivibrio sp. AE3004]|uniref:leucine-rich repeat protein n=1 Tax=Butyrivibrio sp. AE3004 TaxID=1506994 RepID=UPI000494661B|nr:leucine-rich repeat protein [Butyrivibrio sp. AE3004]